MPEASGHDGWSAATPHHGGSAPVWDEPGADPAPPLAGEVDADVCVVGLGVAGLSAAQEAAELGARVVAVDAATVGAGASGRNGGFLLCGLADFHHRAAETLGAETATALYRLTMDELDRAEVLAPDAVRRVGSLRIACDEDERRDCAAQLAAMRRDGLPAEPYDGAEGSGLCFPHDAAVQPLRRARRLAAHAAEAGVQCFEHSPAVRVAGDHVDTLAGRVRCDHVIVCVDGGLEAVLPEVGAHGVHTARAQMLATAPEPRTIATGPVYARWGYDYWQQLPCGRVALGGARDRGGAGEWTLEATPTPTVQGVLEQLLREQLGVTAPITHRWAGTIAFTPGPLPLLEEIRPQVTAVGAYGGTGSLVGAVFGRAAARRALTGVSGLEPAVSPGGCLSPSSGSEARGRRGGL